MRIRLSPFQGMIPRLDAHFLRPGQAERAKDVRLRRRNERHPAKHAPDQGRRSRTDDLAVPIFALTH